ncbi:GNAT family N-acetyltransferase [Arvimicrobium flavum]|uniref:GNAT family N-acetyltransferase n=1 Tax=Arvimicrobium flavum TaxID=3393320 RepID=UPI00237AE684|nr:N-acetyltransferase [Mesorhizobium shangrilense]
MSGYTVRPATPEDFVAIRAVELAAFGGPAEADLVEALRASGDLVLELVALHGDEVVGHVVFSRLLVRSDDREDVAAVALAPLAVAPAHQRRGVGGLLIAEAHARIEPRERLSVVLGEPAYYGRFGYAHARAAGFDSDYQCEALQALAWSDAPSTGRLVYPEPFGAL